MPVPANAAETLAAVRKSPGNRVRVAVARKDRSRLRPGMEVQVTGKTTLSPKSVLAAPDAIGTDTRGNFAWVVNKGTVRRREVRTGLLTGQGIEVVRGLEAGDIVVVSGKESLQDGAAVDSKPRDKAAR